MRRCMLMMLESLCWRWLKLANNWYDYKKKFNMEVILIIIIENDEHWLHDFYIEFHDALLLVREMQFVSFKTSKDYALYVIEKIPELIKHNWKSRWKLYNRNSARSSLITK